MTFYTNLFDNVIRVTFPYSVEAVETVKQFSERTWNADLKCWEIPLRIAHEIPTILKTEIPPKIKEKYNFIYSPQPVKFNPLFFKPEIEFHNFQKHGIEFLSSNKNVLLSDEVGLGKTLQSIGAALHLNCNKVIVICPASVKRQWCREIHKFTDKSCVVIEGSQKQREEQYKQENMFYIVNYELVLKDLPMINLRTWDMVIADEVSRIKNWKSKTKTALLQIKTNFKIAITATPIENSLQELHSIMSWVNPNILGSYWNFINDYCYFCTNPYGGYTVTGIKNTEKLHNILKQVMIRRKKTEVFSELPEIIHNEYYVPLTTAQQKMYKEIEKNIMNFVKKDIINENVLNQIMYLRELCNSPRLLNNDLAENGKIPEIIEITKQFLDNHKIVIFSQWTKFIDLLSEEFKNENINFVTIRGDISHEIRDNNIKQFELNPEIKVILCSDAANMGLNLQFADVLIHCDLLWNPSKMVQREGRIHRIGQKNVSNIITIMTENTIEERVYALLQTKADLFNQIIEGKENMTNINNDLINKIFKTKK